MAETQTVLNLKNIHKSYDDLHVLKGVSLSANKGEVVALIGSSGSGKSTLLRCANLLEVPQQGDIEFQGEAVLWKGRDSNRRPMDKKQVERFRTKLSMVFQQFNLWAHLSILENITEAPITVLGVDPDKARETAMKLLDRVGIADKYDKYPSQLSGGQQQRAAIARALAMEPVAMLFDEPTSALDPELEVEVIKVIKDLANEGRTMLMVTHDMNLVRDLADRVIFLHHGVAEEEGHPSEVLTNPKSERLKQFLNASIAA